MDNLSNSGGSDGKGIILPLRPKFIPSGKVNVVDGAPSHQAGGRNANRVRNKFGIEKVIHKASAQSGSISARLATKQKKDVGKTVRPDSATSTGSTLDLLVKKKKLQSVIKRVAHTQGLSMHMNETRKKKYTPFSPAWYSKKRDKQLTAGKVLTEEKKRVERLHSCTECGSTIYRRHRYDCYLTRIKAWSKVLPEQSLHELADNTKQTDSRNSSRNSQNALLATARKYAKDLVRDNRYLTALESAQCLADIKKQAKRIDQVAEQSIRNISSLSHTTESLRVHSKYDIDQQCDRIIEGKSKMNRLMQKLSYDMCKKSESASKSSNPIDVRKRRAQVASELDDMLHEHAKQVVYADELEMRVEQLLAEGNAHREEQKEFLQGTIGMLADAREDMMFTQSMDRYSGDTRHGQVAGSMRRPKNKRQMIKAKAVQMELTKMASASEQMRKQTARASVTLMNLNPVGHCNLDDALAFGGDGDSGGDKHVDSSSYSQNLNLNSGKQMEYLSFLCVKNAQLHLEMEEKDNILKEAMECIEKCRDDYFGDHNSVNVLHLMHAVEGILTKSNVKFDSAGGVTVQAAVEDGKGTGMDHREMDKGQLGRLVGIWKNNVESLEDELHASETKNELLQEHIKELMQKMVQDKTQDRSRGESHSS